MSSFKKENKPGTYSYISYEGRFLHNIEGLSKETEEKIQHVIVTSVVTYLSELTKKDFELSRESYLITYLPEYGTEFRFTIEPAK